MEDARQSNVLAILEAASYPLTQPQLNSEVGAEARRSQQVMRCARHCWQGALCFMIPVGVCIIRLGGYAKVRTFKDLCTCNEKDSVLGTQRMDIDGLMASTSRVEEGGVRTLSEHGYLCFDIPALSSALQLK